MTHALSQRGFGAYSLQAAISAVHAEAKQSDQTDWAEIVGLYDELLICQPSPIIELNRAVAVAMRDGPEAGLTLVEALLQQEGLQQYHLAHAARADLCRRLGRIAEAHAAYTAALKLTTQAPERRFIEKRLDALRG